MNEIILTFKDFTRTLYKIAPFPWQSLKYYGFTWQTKGAKKDFITQIKQSPVESGESVNNLLQKMHASEAVWKLFEEFKEKLSAFPF